ncbi:MAG: triphosphoribosyl-dephospho-CoA synthase [Betaproteobacteria bacterium HGW-Betaproteobacteria-22]|nr:MAG: triphosphoribosyl-dephospho-CoA synthase [Betaproteobacteria bacterium HGW-Betaproteobacteria-22]
MKQDFTRGLAVAYQSACMAELQAIKPGNVHVFADGHGMTVHDFIKSADVTANVIVTPDYTVGERVFYAVRATKNAVGQNTNLGLLLLCAPLAHAELVRSERQDLQTALSHTLSQLDSRDASLVAQSILMANPGGLGYAVAHDVRDDVKIGLLEMMRYAQQKDRIAWQYANQFNDVLEFGLTRYKAAMNKWQNAAWATTALYLAFLTLHPDTHVVRKHGVLVAQQLMDEALGFEADYWTFDNPKLIQKRLLDWDHSLKQRGINPGTSADLVVATLFVANM